MTAPALLCAGIEVALNRTFGLEPEVLADLARLQGRILAVRVRGLDWDFYLEPIASGVRVSNQPPLPVDVQLSGPPLGLSRLATSDSHVLPPGVEVQGDAELLSEFVGLLRRVDLKPEELLAKVTGDAAAQRLMGGLRSLWGQSNLAARSMFGHGAEYLTEESFSLAKAVDVSDWADDIDSLRDDVARLEARIRALEASTRVSK